MNKTLYILLFTSFVLGACAASTPEPTSTPMPTPSPTPAPWDIDGWEIVWQDEFDGPELNRENWNFDIGGNGWGNGELQYYSDRPENARIENGILVIEAREEVISFSGKPYSSARIKTQKLHTWQYGRIEARIKFPYGQGFWPAFWMMGDNNRGWPDVGEIDIVEFVGKEPNTIHATVHAPGYSRGAEGSVNHFVVDEGILKDDFHVYAIEWEENVIRWYFDDQEYFKLTPEDVPDEWIFNQPFYILINLAVGGRWPGYPDETSVFPQFLLVDYVRVYQRP